MNQAIAQADTWRDELARREAATRERFDAGEHAGDILAARADAFDDALRAAWEQTELGDDFALIAAGGYGRGELHPHSDIDILILTPGPEKAADAATHGGPSRNERIGAFLALAWELGHEIGHAVRSVPECDEAARADLTVITNLMEARRLAGSHELFADMRAALAPRNMWSPDEFFQAKVEEQRARHLQYSDSGYNVEPNVKEGPGGLRDIQTIAWVARRYFDASGLEHGAAARTGLRDLFEHGFLTEDEFRLLRDGQDFLWRVREELHHIAGRREDRLQFHHQIETAARFGYRDADHNLGVEQFMKRYYRAIRAVGRLNELLLQLFRERFLDAAGDGRRAAANEEREAPQPLNERFQVRGDQLEMTHPDVFRDHPAALLELFALHQQHPELRGIRASTLRSVRRHLHLVDDDFRADPVCHELFLDILRAPQGVSHTLSRLHAHGLLVRYLPEFGQIAGLMQFDLFHVYTVDEHLLRTVAMLRRFAIPEHRDEMPQCADIFDNLPQPELLYLAGLFHDIAKGRGSDHSTDGAVDVERFCEHHGINRFDTALISWLVEHHLVMSSTAQREDISDPDTVRRFTDLVGDETRLDHLYLLTIADIRATNPTLWTDWKDSLLRDLYLATHRLLLHGADSGTPGATELVRACREEAHRQFTETGLAPSALRELWETLEPGYFIRTTPDAVAWHAAEILGAGGAGSEEDEGDDGDDAGSEDAHPPPVVAMRTRGKRTEVFFYAADQEYLFAAAMATLERHSVSIIDARVFTSSDGMCFDSLTVAEADGRPIDDPQRQKQIRRALEKAFRAPSKALRPPTRLARRQFRSFPIPPRITFDEQPVNGRTVVEVVCGDRPGLLSRIGRALSGAGLSVHSAKIATFGNRAEDVFHITGPRGKPLNQKERNALRAQLVEALEAPAQGTTTKKAQPPVTGGKKATSSPSATG